VPRVACWLAEQFVLRCLRAIGARFDGNTKIGVALLTVAQATGHGTLAPCEERAISVRAISASLGIPHETIRRYLATLVSVGFCDSRRVGGTAIAANADARTGLADLRTDICDQYGLLVRELEAVGVIIPPAHAASETIASQNPQAVLSTIASNLLLRLLEVHLPVFRNDLTKTAVWIALVCENVRHAFHDKALAWKYASPSGPLPDDLRQPVSAMAVAQSVGFPFETTRRHLSQLVQDRLCVRTSRSGFVVDAQVVVSERVAGICSVSALRVLQSLADLGRAGNNVSRLVSQAPWLEAPAGALHDPTQYSSASAASL